MAQTPTQTPAAGGDGAPAAPKKAAGLAGVVALDSSISFIEGAEGTLLYRGYGIADLAENTDFEEVAYLLWNGDLPNQSQLDDLQAQLRAERALHPDLLDHLRHHTPETTNPMAALRTAVSMLAHYDEEADDMSREANVRKAIRLTAKMPTILAAFDRIRKGKEVVAPSGEGSAAADFLYMLNGEKPGPSAEAIMDAALVLHAEHGLNASTFACRVIGATLSDMYSAITGAIGALKGPLHGGANIRVMQ
ncbi:MAG: citrate/2-methylcitrate synthase, partial [Bacteroidota bacterium]